MNISKVVFNEIYDGDAGCLLANVNIVIEDCIKLSGIRMFASAVKGYYLVFPSKQDLYQIIGKLNPELDIQYPNVPENSWVTSRKPYEEYCYPVNSDYYRYILNVVTDAYNYCIKSGGHSYRPRREFVVKWEEKKK